MSAEDDPLDEPPEPVRCQLCLIAAASLFCADCDLSALCGRCLDKLHLPHERHGHRVRLLSAEPEFVSDTPSSNQLPDATSTPRDVHYTPDYPGAPPRCLFHHEKALVYCVTDKRLICIYCQVHGRCKGHDCVLAFDVACAERSSLKLAADALGKRTQALRALNSQLLSNTSQIKIQEAHALSALDKHFSDLVADIEGRKRDMQATLARKVARYLAQTEQEQLHVAEQLENAEAVERKCSFISSLDDFKLLVQVLDASEVAAEVLQQDVLNPDAIVPPGIECVLSDLCISDTRGADRIRVGVKPPDAPRNMRAFPGIGMFSVCWDPPLSPDSYEPSRTPLTYELQVRVDVEKDEWQGIAQNSGLLFRQVAAHSNSSHQFRVRAWNSTGWGTWTSTVPVQPRQGFTLDPARKGSAGVLSNMNLTATGARKSTVCGNVTFDTGCHYWEVRIDAVGIQNRGYVRVGLACGTPNLDKRLGGPTSKDITVGWNGPEVLGMVEATFPQQPFFAPGMVVGLLLDMDKHKCRFFVNKLQAGQVRLPRNSYRPAVSTDGVGDCVTLVPDAEMPGASVDKYFEASTL